MLRLLFALVFFAPLGAQAAPNWGEDLPAALEAAKKKGSLVLLDFYAPWCYSCYFMDQHVLHEPEMEALTAKVELVKLDTDSAEGARLRHQYGALFMPSYVVLNAQGEEVGRLVGEEHKDVFLGQLREILERNSPLAALEAKARGGAGPEAVAAAVSIFQADALRRTPEDGLKFFERLPPAKREAIESDAAGRLAVLRLKLLSALAEKNAENCARMARVLLNDRDDCYVMYDAFYLQQCLEGLPAAKQRKLISFEQKPLEAFLARRVFGKPTDRCADIRTGVELTFTLYSKTGQKAAAEKLASKALALVREDLKDGLGKDRNEADTLMAFLEMGGRTSELEALYPQLIAAYPKDYVYPYLFGRFLVGQGKAKEALETLDKAKALAYGAGSLRVASARARALAKLGRKEEALKDLDAAMQDHPASFPKEIAQLQKTRKELSP